MQCSNVVGLGWVGLDGDILWVRLEERKEIRSSCSVLLCLHPLALVPSVDVTKQPKKTVHCQTTPDHPSFALDNKQMLDPIKFCRLTD